MEKKSKKKFYKKWWFWLVAVIVAFNIFGNSDEGEESASEAKTEEADKTESKTKNEEKAKTKEPEKKKEMTIEERVTTTINDTVDQETNNDMSRVESINISDDSDAEGMKVANIELNGDDNLTVNLTKVGMLSKSADLFEVLFSEYDSFNKIVLTWNLPLVDVKGNETNGMVLKIGLQRDHGINWEQFDYNNFEHVAVIYFLHNALKD